MRHSANSADIGCLPKANASAKSAADEIRRADAALHRHHVCINEYDRTQALTAAIDHVSRALVLLRSI